jgi:hypothetical protein
MDEARFGLIPIFRRCWAYKGHRPILDVQFRYEWEYMFSVVEPCTGETFTMLWSTVNLEVMQCFLEAYSQSLDSDVICVMSLDGAGWHSEKGLDWPDNIIPIKQPAYSPECNPTERLWTWVRDRLANKVWSSIEELTNRLIEIARDFGKYQQTIKSWVNFHWWQESVNQI